MASLTTSGNVKDLPQVEVAPQSSWGGGSFGGISGQYEGNPVAGGAGNPWHNQMPIGMRPDLNPAQYPIAPPTTSGNVIDLPQVDVNPQSSGGGGSFGGISGQYEGNPVAGGAGNPWHNQMPIVRPGINPVQYPIAPPKINIAQDPIVAPKIGPLKLNDPSFMDKLVNFKNDHPLLENAASALISSALPAAAIPLTAFNVYADKQNGTGIFGIGSSDGSKGSMGSMWDSLSHLFRPNGSPSSNLGPLPSGDGSKGSMGSMWNTNSNHGSAGNSLGAGMAMPGFGGNSAAGNSTAGNSTLPNYPGIGALSGNYVPNPGGYWNQRALASVGQLNGPFPQPPQNNISQQGATYAPSFIQPMGGY